MLVFCSSRRRHARCALVTGVQTCALPILLAIDPGYFRLTGGIERWLYRVARKHAGRQLNGWRFELRHLHAKSASQSRFSDFALHIRAIVRSQSLPGYVLELVPGTGSETLLVMRPSVIEDRKSGVWG